MPTKTIELSYISHNWTEVDLDWVAKYGKNIYDDVEFKLAISEDGDIMILVRLK